MSEAPGSIRHPPRRFGPAVVHRFPDAAKVARAAAQHIAVASVQAVSEAGKFRIALAGGSTPRELYRRIAEPTFAGLLDWPNWDVFFSDERAVPPEHDASNYRMAKEALFDHVPLAPENVHRIRGELGARAAAESYEAELGGPCHVVLLGMGDDGHTASLFPGSPALDETARRVVDAPSPVAPTERVTFTYRALNEAGAALFLITGLAKAVRLAEVLAQIAEGRPELPAARVRPARELHFYLDDAAAAKLPAESP
jgi:6-phosphogluconolactonase